MEMDRRTFLKLGGVLTAASVVAPGSQMLMAAAVGATGAKTKASSKTKWAMVVDLNKCTGCRKCEEGCRDENNVPLYGDPRYDAYWLRVAEMKQEVPGAEERPIPLLCTHCDDPPCVHVCVTKASFVREDGIVLIDEHRCIGCRYCIIACPYRARSIIFKENTVRTNEKVPKVMIGVATKCTFCVHRIDDGNLEPRCVEECRKIGHNALTFGDIRDPNSQVSRLLNTENVQVLRPNLKVGSNVYYIGL